MPFEVSSVDRLNSTRISLEFFSCEKRTYSTKFNESHTTLELQIRMIVLDHKDARD